MRISANWKDSDVIYCQLRNRLYDEMRNAINSQPH